MIEDAQDILNYLPSYYYSEKEQEYLAFLWDTFTCNYENEKYQFAFIAYHMLFMMYVYFSIWKIKEMRNDCFHKALIGFGKDIESKFLNAVTPFSFSELSERNILRFFKLIGFDNAKIGDWAKIVDQRNDVAHSNGNIFFSLQEQLDDQISQILGCIKEMQKNMKLILYEIFSDALKEEDNGFQHFQDQLLRKNYFSQQDMETCLAFNFNVFIAKTKGKKRLLRKIFEKYKQMYAAESK
jgi:hypothetical protein